MMKKQVDNTVCEEMDELTNKGKDKKKNRSMSISEPCVNNVDQEKVESLQLVVVEQSKDSASALCNSKKEKKSSKKRKRLASDGDEYHPDDNEAIEQYKRRKSAGLKESKKKDQHSITDAVKESKQENEQVGNANGGFERIVSEKTNKIQLEHANGNLEKSGDKSASKKSTRKQRNGSAEVCVLRAFSYCLTCAQTYLLTAICLSNKLTVGWN